MRSPLTPRPGTRALPGVMRGAVLAVVLAAGGAGCSDLEDAAAAQSSTGNDLVAELAGQLSASADRTFTARYRLPGGGAATVTRAQDPARTGYEFPGGKVITSTDGTTSCRTAERRPTCTVTAPPAPAGPPAELFARTGLITPDAVLALLNVAALDSDARADQRDTTIAGHHATCVTLRGVEEVPDRGFSTCVTTEGVLGSFTGTVDGKRADVVLTHYADTADPAAFTTPPAADLVDRRKR